MFNLLKTGQINSKLKHMDKASIILTFDKVSAAVAVLMKETNLSEALTMVPAKIWEMVVSPVEVPVRRVNWRPITIVVVVVMRIKEVAALPWGASKQWHAGNRIV